MSRNAADSLFRLYSSAYVPLTFSRDGFDPRQEADIERQLATTAARPRFSPVAVGAFAALALVVLGASGFVGF